MTGAAAPAAARGAAPARGLAALRALLSMIKFQHTLFALPFAFTAAILAAGGWPAWSRAGWILAAMVGARSAAMVFNRMVDLEYDRRNPRTAARPLVTGALTLTQARLFLAAGAALFFLAAAMLNRLALLLAAPALLLILSYSYAKRFTWLTHVHLGTALGLAPAGAWIAVRGTLDPAPMALAAAVLLWVAGFDIIYACQDVEFDRRAGLHSMPGRFGVAAALRIARAFHVLMIAVLALLGPMLALGAAWHAGVGGAAALLFYEHRLVRADDLSRVDQAFFTVNGCLSFLILAATLVDRLIRP